ncbi:MAG: transaldolase [Dehalococcoidales bacterium]|nr:transaldolase [Dehalococcoidales bacterium]
MTDPVQEARRLGQAIWLDFIRRNLITSGELKQMVRQGISGITSNPSIFQKAIARSDDYQEALEAFLKANPDATVEAIYEHLAIADIQMAADILRPVYEANKATDGFVSLEVSPNLAYDTETTIAEARRLWRLVDRPNLMIKVPATPPGIPAVETLTSEGINVNVTLMFSLKHYEAVAHAYIRGIARSPHPERVASVASFFVSRVDTYTDKELEKLGTAEALALQGKAAIANSKLVYRRFREVFLGEDFAPGRERGARVQRVLWGSTSTKNRAYSDVMYVDGLIGPDTVNTLPPETISAFRDHGQARRTVDAELGQAEEILANLERVGVDLELITERLQQDGVKAFIDSFDQLLGTLEERRKAWVAGRA